MPENSGNARSKKIYRTPGTKPIEHGDKKDRVLKAIKELEDIGAAFTITDIAERSGISRATIYRDNVLRMLIGAKGDIPRHVTAEQHSKVCSNNDRLKLTNRELKKRLSETEQSRDEMQKRVYQSEKRLKQAEQHIQHLINQLASKSSNQSGAFLTTLAAQIGPIAMKRARRQIASVLHPDLFIKDPDVAKVATELLRVLNEVVG